MSDPDATQPTPKPVGPHSPGPTPTGYQRTGGGGFKWQPPSPEKLAQLLPQYHIEALIGRGGMGAVYKGTQKALERPVAIKILPPEVDDEDASYTERFKNEAKIMARLEHPAIVPVYDFGETSEGQLYFVMGFINGTDIHQMIQSQGRLPPEHALAITAHVCDALGYAHQHGVIHRDIKPSNILINMEGQVKVADFGLAKAHDTSQSSGLTKTGLAMGTPDYVAPETLSIGMVPDGRADLYAVGVMLYQMLTGQVPRGAFDLPSKLTGCDPRFDSIVIKAMKYDREDRYPTATDLRRDLDIILTAPMVQSGGQSSAAIPKQSLPQKPTGKPVQPRSDAGTPARQESSPAGKSARTTPEPPAKSKTPLYIGLGVAAAIGIGAFVMFGGKKDTKPSAPLAPSSGTNVVQSSGLPSKAAGKAAPPSKAPPQPAKPVSDSPSLPISNSPESQFPPGQWVKVFSKFEDLPQEMRKPNSGVKFEDGWISKSNAKDTMKFEIKSLLRNGGIRARLRHETGSDQGRLSIRGAEGEASSRYQVFYDQKNGFCTVQTLDQAKSPGSWFSASSTPVKLDQTREAVLEIAAVGSRVCCRMNGRLLDIITARSIGSGALGYYGACSIRDIEVINLDGLPEAEALKILGVDEKGNDLRQKPAAVASAAPAAKSPTAPASSSPSLPVPASNASRNDAGGSKSSVPAFPPGQWVKLFTKFEDLPDELRQPDSGVKFEDGWLSIPRRLNLPPLHEGLQTNLAVRVTLKGSQVDAAKFLAHLSLRYDDVSAHSQYMLRQYASILQVASIGLPSDKRATKPRDEILLSHPYAAPVNRSWRLEFGLVASHLIARVDDQLIPMITDKRVMSGRTAGFIATPNVVSDIEVINLDGLPEAEALRILGVDEKGNDLRAVAAKQEQQKAEQAKQADAIAAIPELKTLHEQFTKLTAERVTAPFEKDLAALNTSYLGGLERKMAELKQKGDLDGVLALEAEKKLIADKQPMPAEDNDATPATLKDLRKIYREAHAKLVTTRDANLKALTDPLAVRLKQLESTLTQANRIEHAKTVREYREGLGKEGSAGTPARNTAPGSDAAKMNEADKSVRAPLRSAKIKVNHELSREVAQRALDKGAKVVVRVKGLETRIETAGTELPKGDIELLEINYRSGVENIITDEDVQFYTQAVELRSFSTGDTNKGTITSLAPFRNTPLLERINLTNYGEVTAEDCAVLGSLPNLAQISFPGSGRPIADLDRMLASPVIDHLNLASRLTGGQVAAVNKVRSLSSLDISMGDAGDDLLSQIPGLDQLGRLFMSQTTVTARGVQSLSPKLSKTLRELTFGKASDDSSAAVAAALDKFTTLESFHFRGECSADAISDVKKPGRLGKLTLHQATITPAHITAISQCKALTELTISNGALTAADIAELKKLRLLSYLKIYDNGIVMNPTEMLAALPQLRSLKKLDLPESQFTGDQAELLRKAMPNCQIALIKRYE